jgi:hypothetical protein
VLAAGPPAVLAACCLLPAALPCCSSPACHQPTVCVSCADLEGLIGGHVFSFCGVAVP